jgi:hypothetical protein
LPSTRWETIMGTAGNVVHREPWNKGKLVGQKVPFKPKDIWALRVRLQMEGRVRELALFNLGIDSKLRGCDLVCLKVRDVCHGDQVASRAIVAQQKTRRPVQFELTPVAREAVHAVRSAFTPSRSRCTHSMLCCSTLLTGMKRMCGRPPAS